jgi:hypothetical protein
MEKIFENRMMPVTENHETFVSAPKILRRRLTPHIKPNVNSKIAIEKYNIAGESSCPPFKTTPHLFVEITYTSNIPTLHISTIILRQLVGFQEPLLRLTKS